MSTVFVAYAEHAEVATWTIGAMTILERVLREAAAAGAAEAIVALPPASRPVLPPLPITVTYVAPAAAPPAAARVVAGNVIAGVAVTDRPSRRAAQRALLQACRRSYDGLGDTYVIRPVSLRITPVLARLRLTPNQVTVANSVVGVAAALLVATGQRAAIAAGGVAIFLQVVLDSCDGELARIRHLYSAFGRTLDNVTDDVIDIAMTVALAVALGGWWVPVALIAAVARGSCAVMIFRAVARAGKPGDVMAFRWFFDRGDSELTERFEHRLTPLAVVRSLGRRDAYVVVWAACCLAGVLAPALLLALVVAYGYFGLSLGHRVIRARAAPSDRIGM